MNLYTLAGIPFELQIIKGLADASVSSLHITWLIHHVWQPHQKQICQFKTHLRRSNQLWICKSTTTNAYNNNMVNHVFA